MRNFVIGLIIMAFIIGGIFFWQQQITHKTTQSPQATKNAATVTIDGQTFTVLIANTEQEKEKGLSQRDSLPQNMGMIFPFDKPDYYGFWMKDMKFPLDIIWMNQGKIVTIVNNLQPPTSANPNLPVFKPVSPSDMVLEINAGLANKYNFKVGDSVTSSL